MSERLSPEVRDGFARLMRLQYGLRFNGARERALEHGILLASRTIELEPEALLSRVLSQDAHCTELLIQTLTVGETYFFREPQHFRWLHAFLSGITRPVRLWSAGCATGEEAYTMAIVAREVFGSDADKMVAILATDLNIAALERARRGEFREWSLRGVAEHVRLRWFHESDTSFELRSEAKELVRFRALNLTAERSSGWWPEAIDVAFCRNLLPYLDSAGLQKATLGLSKALHVGGVAICASVDPWLSEQQFSRHREQGILTYRRAPMPLAQSWLPAGAPARAAKCRLRGRAPVAPGPPAPQHIRATLQAPTQRAERPELAVCPLHGQTDAAALARDTASVLASGGQVQQAVEQLSVLLQGQPFDTAAYLLRAEFQQALGAHAEALRDARRALLLEPHSAYAHVLIALSALVSGRLSLARRSIRIGKRLLRDANEQRSTFHKGLTLDEMSSVLAALERSSQSAERRGT